MKVDNIEPRKYVGYYWMSDNPQPILLQNQDFPEALEPNRKPFIIEAQLFDDKQVSYSVKYVDGEYLIQRWDLKADFEGDFEYTEMEYEANHRLENRSLLFRQYWKAEKEELCENIKALRPHALVFVGLK